MLQYPAFMTQYPSSTRTIPTSYLLPAQWPQPQNDEMLLAMEESEHEEKRAETRNGYGSYQLAWLQFSTSLQTNFGLFEHDLSRVRRGFRKRWLLTRWEKP
ncbi:hypothetical protein STAS_34518 [Striga asiatica]|uniref:Uncharacterized protein n=1 Tax=Striga asiatica TaxID=4170 RepID=A0A5A7RI33_STRAF|nr:hypothetical protein STAS_34518 [Striga asiatica]